MAVSLLSARIRVPAIVDTLPCPSSAVSSRATSVTRTPVSAGALPAPAGAPACVTAFQSIVWAAAFFNSTSTTRTSICTWRCTRSWTASRYTATRSSRSGKSVTCSSPALRSRLNVARSDSSPDAFGEIREQVGGGARDLRRSCHRLRRAERRRAGPRGRDVVDVEQAGFRLALEDTDEAAVDRVGKAERLKNEAQRLPHGHVLQVADECAADARNPGSCSSSCRCTSWSSRSWIATDCVNVRLNVRLSRSAASSRSSTCVNGRDGMRPGGNAAWAGRGSAGTGAWTGGGTSG